MSGVAVAGGPPTQSSWLATVQKKLPSFGTLGNTGKVKLLCECLESGPLIVDQIGSIETLGSIAFCTVPIFNADGSFEESSGCSSFLVFPKL